MKKIYYILDKNKKVKKISNLLTWAKWLETNERRIAITKFKNKHVSTVFLGLDYNILGRGKPHLFETMVFSNRQSTHKLGKIKFKFHKPFDEYTERYSTAKEALKGHKRICNMVRKLK